MLTLVSSRKDDLGYRLISLLNAMIIAEAASGRFVFHWAAPDAARAPETVDTLPVREMFAPDFIAAHHVSPAAIRALAPVPAPEDIAGLLAAAREDARAVLVRGEEAIPRPAARAQGPFGPDGHARAFARIHFAPALEAAKAAARAADVPQGAIALHIRAGGLVDGPYRYFGTLEGNITPVQIAEHLIRTRPQVHFLVFCAEADILRHLGRHANVSTPDDLADTSGFSGAARTLFEIVLMSRCAGIIARNHAPAALAGRISGKENAAITDHLGPEECVEVALKASREQEPPQGVPPLQRAMTAWWAILKFRKQLRVADQLQLVRHARRLDPLNPQYWMHECVLLNLKGRTNDVENVLFSALVRNDAAMAIFLENVEAMMRRPASQKRGIARMNSFALSAQKNGRLSMFVYSHMARHMDLKAESEACATRLKALSGLCTDVYGKLEKLV